jgi:hypothetical protein
MSEEKGSGSPGGSLGLLFAAAALGLVTILVLVGLLAYAAMR